jgi:hypothetical protein
MCKVMTKIELSSFDALWFAQHTVRALEMAIPPSVYCQCGTSGCGCCIVIMSCIDDCVSDSADAGHELAAHLDGQRCEDELFLLPGQSLSSRCQHTSCMYILLGQQSCSPAWQVIVQDLGSSKSAGGHVRTHPFVSPMGGWSHRWLLARSV